MPYSLDDKLVIAIASSALFDLTESDGVFRSQGTEAYRAYQREHQNDTLAPGVAFPFIERLLGLNDANRNLVEVLLLSRNDPDTGLRVLKSIESHRLNISRAAFVRGRKPWRYIKAFSVSLFLSACEHDVKEAIMEGHPAGLVLGTQYTDDHRDHELRIAFDFDGVLVDDQAEKVFQEHGLARFHSSERASALEPHAPGPLQELLIKIANIQAAERQKAVADPAYQPRVRLAIITARNAPAHERMITTLRHWGITVDETFFLGGIDKRRVLEVFAPHLFFDDQRLHLDANSGSIPCVHVPFGELNGKEGPP